MDAAQPPRPATPLTLPAPVAEVLASDEWQLGAERLVEELLVIPGASGDEQAMAQFVRDKLIAAGCPPEWIQADECFHDSPIQGKQGNLVVRLPGTQPGPRLLLSSHLDTVPICVGCEPIREGRIVRTNGQTGLGADNRAGVAVLLHTVCEIFRRKWPHPPLTFLWTVQEEVGLQGARLIDRRLLEGCAWGFNWDGGVASKVVIGATGGYRMTITVRGLASHAGNAPEAGVSALAIVGLAVADLHRSGWHGRIEKDGELGTSNIGVVQGGTATNVVADWAEVRAEARSHQRVFRERIVAQIEQAFRQAAHEVVSSGGQRGSVEFAGRLDYESFVLASDTPCVQRAVAAVDSVGGANAVGAANSVGGANSVGSDAQLAIGNGGLDANWLTLHGVPTVTLGCGQRGPHTTSEQLDLDELVRACRIACHIALGSPSMGTQLDGK